MRKSYRGALGLALLPLAVATHATAQAPADDPVAIMDTLATLPTADLWPGFDLATIPVAIYDGQRTFLFRHPAPPEGFEPLPDRPDVLAAPGLHESVRANSLAPIGNVLTAVAMLNLLGEFETARDRAGVIVHESFHVFEQEHHPDWGANELELFVYPLTQPRPLALRRLEGRALRRALDATAPRRKAAWAAAALAVRKERFAALPASAAEYERETERMEGLAQYVQHEATGSLNGAVPLPDSGFAPAAIRFRGYATAHVLARLLDELVPDWPARVESGEAASLDAALEQGLRERFPDVEPSPWRDGLPAALERATAETRALVAERDSTRRAFLGRPGWRIVVATGDGAPLGLRGMDPMNITRLGHGQLLHTRWLRLANEGASLEVLDGAILTTPAGDHPLANGVRTAVVTGLEQEPTVRRTGDTVTIEAASFTGTFEGAGVDVDRDEQVVRVRPGA